MSDDDYLILLEQGVDCWNRWRKEHPEIRPNLSTVYLFQANLSGVDLSGVDLSRACLIGANLQGANLKGADLGGAYASGANLAEADLTGTDLTWTNFSDASLTHADLSRAKATATNFTGAKLTGACLAGCQIDPSTHFDGVDCEYFFLQSDRQQRQVLPQNGKLTSADFVKLLGVEAVSESGALQSHPFERQVNLKTQLLHRHVLIGAGVAAIALIAITTLMNIGSQPANSPQALPTDIPELANFPCREPSPPPIPDRQPDHEYQDGTRYYGEFANGRPANGRGIMVFSSGNRYDGNYRNGKRNGCGTFTFANGRRYMGQFRSDQFSGMGMWTLENGDRYIGEFRENKCNGKGTFIFANGSSQSGIWKDGEMVGRELSCDRNNSGLPQSPSD